MPLSKSIVVIESPFAGDVEANIEYGRLCLLDSLERGEAPVASHLLYTQVLIDEVPEQRQRGMDAGHAFLRVADRCAVYVDKGISPGMQRGIDLARAAGVLIQYRRIF